MAFVAITVPLALDAVATTVAWSVQGVATCWLGVRQRRPLALLAGLALQGLAAANFVIEWPGSFGLPAVLNGPYLSALFVALAAIASSALLDLVDDDERLPFHGQIAAALLAWGTLWWVGAGAYEIDRTVSFQFEQAALLIFAAGTVALAALVGKAVGWSRPGWIGLLLILFLPAAFFYELVSGDRPSANLGWLGWLSLAGAHVLFLRLFDGVFRVGGRALHLVGYLTFVMVAVVGELGFHLNENLPGIWPAAIVLAALTGVFLATQRLVDRIRWPFATPTSTYAVAGAGTVCALTGVSMLIANGASSGAAGDLPWLPLLNPLEFASLIVCAGTVIFLQGLAERESLRIPPRPGGTIAVGTALYLLTMLVARAVHHYTGVPFDLDRLADSEVFQTALSIVWSAAAFLGMIFGARKQHRFVWLGGAALMAVVVGKLFLVDLANTATVERVVSFLGVGILLLVVGYFAPVPPKDDGAGPADAG